MKLLNTGTQVKLLDINSTSAGSTTELQAIQSDAVLVTLFVESVVGTVDVTVYAVTNPNDKDSWRRTPLFSFPTVSAPTTNLVLRRSSIVTAVILVEAVYSDACVAEVFVRAVGTGTSDTKILGAGQLQVSQVSVSGTPVELVPSSLTDRNGLVIKNWATNVDVFVGTSAGTATPSTGYPLAGRDALAVDVSAGTSLWASTAGGTADVRIVEAGS